ncbi:hypothetical protein CMO83_00385 [Candidatus Woesearchaeota archaeon]|jgi:tRNA (guanine10-N2)-dimethyltransferase|nr:hypothetical protein [Candidatus Woesearchaeota archaeon]MDP6648043.1 methyltransferase domain-containing protein [Candidatus Woesearchaeota archaeon]|tara:strand:- start:35038 stop:36120 length:1083 start_codon:yes stop_codon:yes gene_type:complete
MHYLFLLSGDYIGLAKEEVLSLFDVKDCKIIDRLLIVDIDKKSLNKLSKRLALTKEIHQFLFECKIKDLIKTIKKYDWNSIYKNNFCLRVSNLYEYNEKNHNNKKNLKNKKFSEKNLAGYIWDSLKKPKVDLENPRTNIGLFFIKEEVYCGLLLKENKEDFESRKAHLRPFSHPGSLHPKVARALINISGIKDETLVDPFCGTGGFMIEAGLMGIKTTGIDISKFMIKGCKENLKHFKTKNAKVINKNALSISGKPDYVITDLPYGLNSNVYLKYNKKSLQNNSNKLNLKMQKKNFTENLGQFYLKFLKKLRKILKYNAVIIFPSYVDHKKLLKASGFKIEKEFSIYVHRSLTRKIVRIS